MTNQTQGQTTGKNTCTTKIITISASLHELSSYELRDWFSFPAQLTLQTKMLVFIGKICMSALQRH